MAWVTLVVLVLSGGIALLIAMRLRRWISTPVTHLSQRMREIAEGEGDLTRRMEIDQEDEVGQLAYWFNTFLTAQRDRVALIAGNARLLGASSDQIATIPEQMSSNAEETSNQASVVNTASERVSGNLQRVAAAAEQLHGGAREIAAHVTDSVAVADKAVRDRLRQWEGEGYGHFPVCMAKTQYSFSTDPNLKGAPSDHVVPVREVRLSGGAEFVVAICGQIMTLPGLPKVPAANNIGLDENGLVEGLF